MAAIKYVDNLVNARDRHTGSGLIQHFDTQFEKQATEEDRVLRPRTLKILHIEPSHCSWRQTDILGFSGKSKNDAVVAEIKS